MLIMQKFRDRASFMERIATKDFKTLKAYNVALDNFELFCKTNKRKLDEDTVQAWINSLYKTHSPRTIHNMYSRIRKYFRHLKIILDDIQLPNLHEKELYPLSLTEIHQLFQVMKYPDVTMFMCQLSGGLRIGELVQLKKKDLHFTGKRFMVKIPHTISKNKKARTTFFSSEASSRLPVILKNLSDNDLIFGTNKNPHYSETIKETNLNHALEKTGLDFRYDDTNWHKINTHSFRAYFITKVSRIDPNMAKKLSGEKGYLLQYDRMTNEEYVEFYDKIESELLIFDLAKKDQKIRDLQEAKRELEIKNERIEALEKRFEKEIQKDEETRKQVTEFLKKIADPNYHVYKDPQFIEMMKPKPKIDIMKQLEEMAKKPKDPIFNLNALIKRNIDN